MRGGKHLLLLLLLLAAFVLLARCQQKPTVSMYPEYKEIFSGDLLYLTCIVSPSGSKVKWYINNTEQMLTDKTWKIPVANPEDSGFYQCESNGQKSDGTSIVVSGYIPRASLTMKTGQPVIRTGGSVVLQLDNDDGLQGWRCWVHLKDKRRRLGLRLKNDSVSLAFDTPRLFDRETIFWCTDRTEQRRSNQITVRTSDKDVSLEMYPLPAVAGDELTLRCLVWGTDRISHTVFYKDDKIILNGVSPTHKISNVADSAVGKYKCNATFTYMARTDGPPYKMVSDDQDLFVQAAPIKAVLSNNNGMSCSCPLCPSGVSFRWHKMKDDGQPPETEDRPKQGGTYKCSAVWNKGRSLLSNSMVYEPLTKVTPSILIVVIIIIMLLLLGSAFIATGFYFWNKRRNDTGPIYEDVALTSRDKGDDKYEPLQRAPTEAEYDALRPEPPHRVKKEGEYEPLKKEETKEGEYHTLGMEGAAGGAGGYEALRKQGMKEGEYHTLGMEGAAGGAGGYEALRKQGMKEGVYHTLGMEEAAGGAGAYEALKKEGMKGEVYHTLGMEGAGGGDGGYEAVGRDKDREYERVEENK